MSFFDFEEEKTEMNGYMKIKDGENKIRILSKSISYVEDWIDNKPVRYKLGDQPPQPHDPEKDFKTVAAFIVWNYVENKIQILQLRQASIRKKLRSLHEDPDWGQLYFYDLKIIRSGKDLLTKYDINPLPHKPVSASIIEAFKAKPIFLEALLLSKDPFAQWPECTSGVFTDEGEVKPVYKESTASVKPSLEDYEVAELDSWFSLCQPGYKESVMARLYDKFKYTDLSQMTRPIYEILKVEILNKKKEYADFLQKEQEAVGF